MKMVTAVLLSLVLAGCAYNMELISFDTGETLHGGFNVASKEVWVDMGDGTRLSGNYVELRDDSITFGAATGTAFAGSSFGAYSGFATGYSLAGTSTGYAILRAPDTPLMMEVMVRANQNNKGMGEAVTNDGRSYKVIF